MSLLAYRSTAVESVRSTSDGSSLERAHAPESKGVDATLVFWFGYVVLTPVYIFPSGGLQLSDFVLAVAMASFALSRRPGDLAIPPFAKPSIRIFVVFTYLVAMVNLGWSWMLAAKFQPVVEFTLSTLYTTYSLISFLFFVLLYRRYGVRLLKATLTAVSIGIVIAAVSAIFTGAAASPADSVSRVNSTFNNANQLAYFAALAAALLFFTMRYASPQIRLRSRVARLSLPLLWLAIAIICFVSGSRAGIYSLPVLGLIALLRNPARVLLLVAALVVIVLTTPFGQRYYGVLSDRVELFGGGKQDNEIDVRNYERLTNFPIYMLVGGGEGDHGRFHRDNTHEIHSSWGTLLFAYGITGLALHFALLLSIYRKAGRGMLLSLVPVFLFALTHNGLRFRLFWIVLAFMLCEGALRSAHRETPDQDEEPAAVRAG